MRYLVALALTTCLAGGSVLAAEFSREVGIPLEAATAEIKKNRWDAAMAKINEADAVKKKSDFEQYKINELKAYVFSRQGNYTGVADIYEKNLQSGMTPAGQVGERLKTITQIYARQRNDAKTIEYGNRWIKAGGASDPDAYQLVAQSHYQQKDYRAAAKTIQQGIDAAQKRGKSVEENWLVLKLNSYYALKDDKGILETREQLVRNFPKPQYWQNLLDILSRRSDDDKVRLNFYRLMLDLDVLKNPSDYVEMAQMMMDQEFGIPGEAVQVIQKGFDNKVLENKDRERHVRVLTAAKTRAEEGRKLVAAQEQKAQADQSGAADVRLGSLYLSYGQHEKAVTAISRGIQKGKLKDADEARMLLGLAYYRAGQKTDASNAFKSVANDSALATVADLWAIRVQQS